MLFHKENSKRLRFKNGNLQITIQLQSVLHLFILTQIAPMILEMIKFDEGGGRISLPSKVKAATV